MEDTSNKNNLIRRVQRKKATVKESLKVKNFPIHQSNHKRPNSEKVKYAKNKGLLQSVAVLNLITKGPSINKLFFKNDNISLKSGSMPKANKKMVKKFRSIHIDKEKNNIYNNITIKKKYEKKCDSIHSNNFTLNYYNMDCIEKIHNLKGDAKDFLSNNMKKSKKPNFISKNYISNDKLINFNSNKNANPIYDFYSPIKGNEPIKKPLQKKQSLNQEKRNYKFSDFKVIKNVKKEEEDDDESYENINPDDYREGNNIQLIDGNSFSEENDESSSLSSNEKNEKSKKENKKKKTDKLSNLINKSIKNNEKQKLERNSSLNYYNSNNNSEIEDNYFINDTKIFMSPQINSKHPSNKSLKSDAKSDYFNNVMAYFNDSTNINDSLNKNSFLGGLINKNKVRKKESLATNSNYDYEGDDEGNDLVEMGNKLVNNLNINDSFNNIKSPDISQNNVNISLNNENISNIHTIKNINNYNEYSENPKNNAMNNYNFNNNFSNSDNNKIENIPIINFNNNRKDLKSINNNINNINNDFRKQNNNDEFPIRNLGVNPNQSNIINIHNMNNFNNNNFIFGNGNSGSINSSQLNSDLNNSNNNSMNNMPNNDNNIPQNSIISELSPFLLNKLNLYNYQGNNRINEANFNVQNYIINKNNLNKVFLLSQLAQNNNLGNGNNQYINYDIKNNPNRYILNNSNFYQQNINNNINSNFINNINSNINYNFNNLNNNYNNANNLFNLNNGGDNQNNNLNLNLLNYYNSQNNFNQFNFNSLMKKQKKFNNYQNQNIINQNTNIINQNPNLISQNLNIVNQNPNIINQSMIKRNISTISNPNFLNQLQFNNYINQNNNINLNNNNINQNNLNLNNNNINYNNMNLNNNINLNNGMNLYGNINSLNSPIIQSKNLSLNSNINNPSNNNINYNENYNMIFSMGNINHMLLSNNKNLSNTPNKQSNYIQNKQKKQNLNLLSNEELAKQAYILAKNQNGCRYLQKRIENNQNLVATLFFPNILGHIQELSNDQFGNYYIKIIIKYLPEEMIIKFIQLIHPSISKIGTNQYGTKVLQYLIDFLDNDKNISFFIKKTLPHVVTLINDLNGIHIIQKLICIKSEYIQYIYNEIFQKIELIAVTRDGSNFIKKLIEFLDEKNMISLINAINENLSIIITNQYGNHIIQNIIIKENLVLKYKIIETIIKNIVNFSIQKFSSNVVEKCFEVEEMKDKVIDEIIKNNNFEQILLNEFGNYVIQKALLKSDQNKQFIMFKLLATLVHKLQCLPFGQKLLSKLFILYPKLSIYILNSGD